MLKQLNRTLDYFLLRHATRKVIMPDLISDNEAEKILKELIRHVEKIAPQQFLKFLLRTHFRMPVHELPVEESEGDGSFRVLQDELNARFRTTKDSKGRESLPIFISDECYRLWMPEGGPYIGMFGQEFLQFFRAGKYGSLLINPGSDLYFELTSEEIETIIARN